MYCDAPDFCCSGQLPSLSMPRANPADKQYCTVCKADDLKSTEDVLWSRRAGP